MNTNMSAGLSDPFIMTGKLYYNEYVIDLDKILGKGAFGTVYPCTRMSDNQNTEICVKIVKRVSGQETVLQKEMDIVKKIGEKKIQVTQLVKTYEIFEEPSHNYVYFFMEKCDTTLDKYMLERFSQGKRFSQDEIQNMISHLATGYKSLAQMGIIHRDLKPENILITIKQSGPVFKISDYGAGTIVSAGKQAVTNAGSPFYQAPEILLQDPNAQPTAYNNKCDIYSLGIIIYTFSYGSQHIKVQTMFQLKNFLIRLKDKPFKCPEDERVPQEVKELIEKMIVYNEEQRISWADLQKFKLFEGDRQETQRMMNVSQNNNMQISQQNNVQAQPVVYPNNIINRQVQQNNNKQDQQIQTINKFSQQQQSPSQYKNEIQTLQYQQVQTNATNSKPIVIKPQNGISLNTQEPYQVANTQKPNFAIKFVPSTPGTINEGLNNQYGLQLQQNAAQPNNQIIQTQPPKIILQQPIAKGNNIKIRYPKQDTD